VAVFEVGEVVLQATGSGNSRLNARRGFPDAATGVGGGVDAGDEATRRKECWAVAEEWVWCFDPREVVGGVGSLRPAGDGAGGAANWPRTLQTRRARELRRVDDVEGALGGAVGLQVRDGGRYGFARNAEQIEYIDPVKEV